MGRRLTASDKTIAALKALNERIEKHSDMKIDEDPLDELGIALLTEMVIELVCP
ncbi:hypothetical protein AGMMS49949_07110 [Alphaproteobacteria bacterium]|nr:hypothetical protein AGMMS49949_07110 [Alphaproteobacteria bacterium]GHS98715.1 hypothetical protein AGMMS50296_6550 [Alphaproteobacteria bacterium]